MFKKVVKFSTVGLLNTSIGYILFLIFEYFGIYYILSGILAYMVGIVNSYFWNRNWTFKSHNKISKELPKFLTIYAISFIINVLVLYFFVERLKIVPNIAEAFAIFFAALFSFVGHNQWSFNAKVTNKPK